MIHIFTFRLQGRISEFKIWEVVTSEKNSFVNQKSLRVGRPFYHCTLLILHSSKNYARFVHVASCSALYFWIQIIKTNLCNNNKQWFCKVQGNFWQSSSEFLSYISVELWPNISGLISKILHYIKKQCLCDPSQIWQVGSK